MNDFIRSAISQGTKNGLWIFPFAREIQHSGDAVQRNGKSIMIYIPNNF